MFPSAAGRLPGALHFAEFDVILGVVRGREEVSTKPVMGTSEPGRRRHRSWPEALKREIVAASYAPGSSVSMVARHYDVNANQVFSWRKLYRDDPGAAAVSSVPQLIRKRCFRPT